MPTAFRLLMMMSRATSQSDQPVGTEIVSLIGEPSLFVTKPSQPALYPAAARIDLALAGSYLGPSDATTLLSTYLSQEGSRPVGFAAETMPP